MQIDKLYEALNSREEPIPITLRLSNDEGENESKNYQYVDDLNIKILEHYSDIILSKEVKDTWRVSIQM